MTDYGVTPTGYKLMPKNVVFDEVTQGMKAITGLADVPTEDLQDIRSVTGGLIAWMTDREYLMRQEIGLVFHSAFKETATGNSLDRVLARLFKSRLDARHSLVPLTLYNRSEQNSVPVPAESQARQGATGVQWETTEDAEIPALSNLLEDAAIANITWQSGTTVRLTFEDSDLSAVAVGDLIEITGALSVNNGSFTITDINPSWVEYSNPDRTNGINNETGSDGLATISDTETSVTVNGRSRNRGVFEASINSINETVSIISGWDGVSNLEEANVGRAFENDDAARVRAAEELAIAQGSTIIAIQDEIGKVTGVTYVSVTCNRTGAVDSDGLKANSYNITVTGGDDQDIIDAIGRATAGGIDTNGSEVGEWIDPTGEAHPFAFERATERAPYFVLGINRTALNYPADGTSQIQNALDGVKLERNQDLYSFEVVTVIGNLKLAGVKGISVLQGFDPAPATSDPLIVGADEVINIRPDRITVNYTDA